MIGFGVLAGAHIPQKPTFSSSGKPASRKVGTSGNCDERSGPLVAMPIRRPSRVAAANVPTSAMTNCTSLLSSADSAGGPPL
jgi:hypothetical protein